MGVTTFLKKGMVFLNKHHVTPASIYTLEFYAASTTSVAWETIWPAKPDIVLEGGNMAINDQRNDVDFVDSLQLLTTHNDVTSRLFCCFGDTSASAALAAKMAGTLMSRYSWAWPETVRALLVHSAEWNSQMVSNYPQPLSKQSKYNLLKTYGHGVPSLEKALWSASDSLTLIVQEEMEPFEKKKFKEIHYHRFPWPEKILRDLGAQTVRLKVTLSYFVQADPTRRGNTKYQYRSHGLRFNLIKPGETISVFEKRINKAARENETSADFESEDGSGWLLGSQLRFKGSIHSDVWEGTAADLADRNLIAVSPGMGWWREQGLSGKRARYSLVVTIETPSIDVDIYTPIATSVEIPT